MSGSYSNSQCVQVEDLSRDVKNISCTIQLGLYGYSGISGQMSFLDKDKETIIQISEFKNNSLVKTVPYVTENGIDYFVMNLAWISCSPLKDGVVKVGYDVIANIIGGDVDENGIIMNNLVQSKDAIYSPNGFYQDTYS